MSIWFSIILLLIEDFTSILFEGWQSSVGFYFSYIAIAILRKGKVKDRVGVKWRVK